MTVNSTPHAEMNLRNAILLYWSPWQNVNLLSAANSELLWLHFITSCKSIAKDFVTDILCTDGGGRAVSFSISDCSVTSVSYSRLLHTRDQRGLTNGWDETANHRLHIPSLQTAYFLTLKMSTSLASRLLISDEGKLLLLLNCWHQGPSVKGITLSVWKMPRKIQYVYLSKM